MKKHILGAVLVMGAGFSAVPATAVTFGTRSGSTAIVANCPSGPLGGVCTPGYVPGSNNFGPGVNGIEDYNPNKPNLTSQSFARLMPPTGTLSYGSATAFVLPDADRLPVLKAGAFTQPNELGRYTTSYAYMASLAAYTNTGSEALALPLVGDIDFIISFANIDMANPLGPGSFPYSFGNLSAQLVIGTEAMYQGGAINPAAWVCGEQGVLAAALGSRGVAGFNVAGATQNLVLSLDASNSCGGGEPVMIAPGENFYVYGLLQVLALQGATVNATNSFNIGFAPGTSQTVIDSFAVSATPVNVPEPASWAMLIGGFALVGAMARRRRVGMAN